MEYIRAILLLVHVISTSSLSLESRSKRISLRSIDPLTRRSSIERNFIRFGRSVPALAPVNVNKREIYEEPEAADAESRPDKNPVFCLFPQDHAENLLCVGPRQNLTDYGPEDEAVSNQTEIFSRNTRASDTDRIRKSKGGNFMRLGRGNVAKTLFNRFDRGRDNFMRLGRSWNGDQLEKRKHDSFMRLGRGDDLGGDNNQFNRKSRKHDSFMRLGRDNNNNNNNNNNHNNHNNNDDDDENDDEDDEYERTARRHDSFIRYGRGKGDEDSLRAADDLYERMMRGHENFMRLGRNDPFARSQRRHDNFMRLGRVPDAENLDRNIRRSDNFMRLGRDAEQNELSWIAKRSKNGNFMRLGRGSGNFPRSRRSVADGCSTDCRPAQPVVDVKFPELISPKKSCREILENMENLKRNKIRNREIEFCLKNFVSLIANKNNDSASVKPPRIDDFSNSDKCEGYPCKSTLKKSDNRWQRKEVDGRTF